jgi:hypothetical protein
MVNIKSIGLAFLFWTILNNNVMAWECIGPSYVCSGPAQPVKIVKKQKSNNSNYWSNIAVITGNIFKK